MRRILLPAYAVCLFFCGLLFILPKVNAQNAPKSTPVTEALNQVTKAFGTQFVYDPEVVQGKATSYNLSTLKTQNVEDILKGILYPNKLVFLYVKANYYTIVPKERVGYAIESQNVGNISPQIAPDGTYPSAVKTITGTVTGPKGEMLSGVTITVNGSRNSTQTKANGTFSISNVTPQAILAFSYVGYASTTQVVGNESAFTIIMQAQTAESLDEVVVVGYGTQRKGSVTGAVATVSAKTFQDRGPLSSPVAALQGQVPGVTVTRGSSQPGRENWNFLVRGNSSINGSEPLIIVDGLALPSSSALNSFNPDDIDNISFLKDAAAASIYGARAAGGVVLITTKRAKGGKTTINYNGSVSRKIVGLQPKLTDIKDWGPLMKEARTSDGFLASDIWSNYADMAIYAVQNNRTWLSKAEATTLGYGTLFTDVKDFVFFPGTMQDVLWGGATSTEHQLNVASRGDRAGYRISLGFLDDGSLLQVGNNSNKRYNLRLAHDYQISSKLKLESNISLEKNDILQPSNIGAVLNNGIQPGLPLTTQDGKPYIWGSGIGNATVNNIANSGGDGKELNTRINTNFNLTYNFNKNLRAVGAVGYYLHNTDYRTRENVINWYDYTGTILISSLSPSGQGRSFYQRVNRKEVYYNLNAYLEYNKTFATDHSFRAMAGAQYERDEYNAFFAKTFDIVAGVPSSLNLSTGDATSKTVSEGQNHYALSGYFGRLNYAYKNKYLLEVNGRYDGSSKFSPDNRWKGFYGASVGWRIMQEKFMQNVKFLNDVKLRASYGNVGNQNGIGLYDYLQLLNLNFSTGATSSGFPILGTSPVVRVSPGGLVALDRTWERVETYNLGLDFALLKNRLSGSVDAYEKRNNNMLINRTLPSVLGASAPAGNLGKLKTSGYDIALNWRDNIGKLNYHIGGNISYYTNTIISTGGAATISSGNRGLNAAIEGYPINSYFGLVYDGRIQDQKTLDDYRKYITGNNVGMPSGATTAQANARLALGDNMFKDMNGDGKITFPEDAVYLGTDDPRLAYSFNGGVEFKGFDFNFIFQGVGDRTIIRDGNWRIPANVIFQAQNAAFLNQWWTPTRTDAALPRISSTGTINNYNYFPSDFVTENGAYLRLKNLVVGYTLPRSITQRVKIERLRFYFSGNDLWEVTKIRDGWDPEATRNVANTGDGNNNGQSTFSARYPFYRYLTFGLNLTF